MQIIKKFILELMTEELPSKILQKIENTFTNYFINKLKSKKFLVKNTYIKTFSTSRRIGLYINNVKNKSNDKIFKEKILSINIIEFNDKNLFINLLIKKLLIIKKKLKINNISKNQLIIINKNNKKHFFFYYNKNGICLKKALQVILQKSINKLSIYKFMKYQIVKNNIIINNLQFIRPIINLLVLYGQKIISLNILNVISKNITYGNRFLLYNKIVINDAKNYSNILIKKGKVIPNFLERKKKIKNMLLKTAGKYKIFIDEFLLNEITSIVEWPNVYLCKFDKKFLSLPNECINTIIQSKQKHFILKNKNNNICEKFLIVCNTETKKNKNIIQGYEQSINYILNDIKLFFEKDKKKKLFKKIDLLKNTIYYNNLGSQYERVKRIKKIAIKISNIVKCDKFNLERAILLSKVDLLTEIVKKFPNLQGIIGKHYAMHDKENYEVAEAIAEHYLPKFSNDILPKSNISIIISIADRLEFIVGFIIIGLKSNGDNDLFALRRNTIGLLRILIEKQLLLSIPFLINISINVFKKKNIHKDIYFKIYNFIYKKLQKLLLKYNFNKYEIESIFFKKPEIIGDLFKKLNALKFFFSLSKAKELIISNKRIYNFIKNEYNNINLNINKDLLKKKYEKDIFLKIEKTKHIINNYIKNMNYKNMFKKLINFNKYINIFLKKIIINTNNIKYKNNRKTILLNIHMMLNQIFNLSYLNIFFKN